MNKKLILKTAFLFIITAAFTFTAKAQIFNIDITNNRSCSVLVEVLDINSNVLYSGTVGANTTLSATCVGSSISTPTGIIYTGTGCSPSPVIPVAANNLVCSTCCTTCFNTGMTGAFNNSMISATGCAFYIIDTTIKS